MTLHHDRRALPLLLPVAALLLAALLTLASFRHGARRADASAPGYVTQSSPSSGASGQSPTLTLSWLQPSGAIPGTTQYTVSLWDPNAPPAGHYLGDLPATTSLSKSVPASEQLLHGMTYSWAVDACNGSDCSGFASGPSAWFSFTIAAHASPSASGVIPTGVVNGDFSGQPTVSGTIPGWTGSATLTQNGNGTSYIASLGTLSSTTLALDYPSLGSAAWFRIGYRLHTGGSLSATFGSTSVFSSSTSGGDPANTWLEKSFSVPASAGASGALQLAASGTADVAYVERQDGPAGPATPRLGVTANAQFPMPLAAVTPGGIDLATGTYVHTETDLALAGFSPYLPLTFTRAYNSAAVSASIANGASGTLVGGRLGPKWSDNWDYRVQELWPNHTVVVWTPGGTASTFNWDAADSVYVGPAGVNAWLTVDSSSHYTLTVPQSQVDYGFTVLAGNYVAFLTTVSDRNGNQTTLSYNGSNQLTTITDAGGRYLSLSYDGSGRIHTVSDSAGRSVSYGYDGSTGDLTSVTDARGNSIAYSYAVHDLTQGEDQNTHLFVRNAYDSLDRVTSQKDADGNQATVAYASPSAGVTQVTAARSKTSSYYFDTAQRVTDVTDPLSHTWSRSYGQDDVLTLVAAPLSQNTAYSYDGDDNLTQTTDAWNYAWQYSYDGSMDLLQIHDPNSHTQTFTYDGNNNLHTAKDGLSHTATYTVNGSGQVTALADPDGHSFTYGYNGSGDLTSVSGAASISYGRDAVGRRTSMTDSTGTTSYSYNAFNELTATTYPGAIVVGDGYDAAGNRTSITYPGGSNQVTYGYDDANRLTAVEDWNSKTTALTYDADGNLAGMTLPSGTGISSSYTVDDADRLTDVTHTGSGGTLASAAYTLDAIGNRTQIVTQSGSTSYKYDAVNRLTAGGANSYTYDPVGNRLSLTNGGTTSYSYDAADRLTAAGSTSYSSDNNGNTTGRGSDSFTWNALNQLTSATVGGVTTTATYNGDGLRQSRTSGSTTDYTWDVAGLPVILDDGTYDYVYGAGPGPLARIAKSGGATQYYLADGLGSTVALTDSSGSVLESYSYDPFGAATASGTAPTEFQFAGHFAARTSQVLARLLPIRLKRSFASAPAHHRWAPALRHSKPETKGAATALSRPFVPTTR